VPKDVCPIKGLTTDPLDPKGLKSLSKKFNETAEQAQLTQQLEAGMNGYSLLSDKTQKAEQCIANLVGSVLAPEDSGYAVSSTVRTLAYQAHLRAVWDKFLELQDAIEDDPSIQQKCPALIAEVEGEMGFRLDQDPEDKDDKCGTTGRKHCIRVQPAKNDPRHTQNVAFDISSKAVDAFINKYTTEKRDMATGANECNLTWGGTFKPKKDPVHFLCCTK